MGQEGFNEYDLGERVKAGILGIVLCVDVITEKAIAIGVKESKYNTSFETAKTYLIAATCGRVSIKRNPYNLFEVH